MAQTVSCWIGLGSNLDDPLHHLRQARLELAATPLTHLVRSSSLYRSAPMGPADQPDYLNAVIELLTELTPLSLLRALQRIEFGHGRVRTGVHWGARTLDLDLLLYGGETIAEPSLVVPHPGIAERVFVLEPLHECAPALEITGLGRVESLLAAAPDGDLERLNDGW